MNKDMNQMMPWIKTYGFGFKCEHGPAENGNLARSLESQRFALPLLGLVALIWAKEPCRTWGQPFDSGSNGSRGPLIATNALTVLQTPPDGIFHFTRVIISPGVTVKFLPNALNTPVYILATEDVQIGDGALDVNGSQGGTFGGVAGPGGFNGGSPGGNGLPPGDGLGPGGGKAGADCVTEACAGGGSYSTTGTGATTNKGSIYGSPLLLPIVGGSGGGGSQVAGGGGGGGAIVIAANQFISINRGRIYAQGGANSANSANGGSGGAIRLIAPKIYAVPGFSILDVSPKGLGGGPGRVRIDTWDFNTPGYGPPSINPPTSASNGKVMFVFPPTPSRLSVVAAAGQIIPEGTNSPVSVYLPFGSPTNQVVRVQARDFVGVIPINVVVTPGNGPRQVFPAEINMASGNPGFADVNVVIPVNTEAMIHAWTR